MKRITMWIMSTLSVLVLLFSYHTSTEAVGATTTSVALSQPGTGSSSNAGATQTTTSGGSGTGGTSGGATDSSSTATSSASATSTATSSSASSSTKTYTGSSVLMRYGTVQVRITVKDGKVVSSEAIDYPMSNGRDQEINSAAIPTLNSEAAGQSSSSIDMVSGATYTSQAYIQSLQSALDQANA